MKHNYKLNKLSLLILFIMFSLRLHAASTVTPGLSYPQLVNKFYVATNNRMFWFSNTDVSNKMRLLLLQKIENTAEIGTDKSKYHYIELHALSEKGIAGVDSSALLRMDMLFTDAAIAYSKDLYQGEDIYKWLSYDEWTKKYADKDNDFIVNHLAAIRSAAELIAFIQSLEPTDADYKAYKEELTTQYQLNNQPKIQQIIVTMNFYRWVHHFNFPRFIVVNVGAATLHYYENDKDVLFSKMIVGKASTRTPRFSATCHEVILYPYWNVPRTIAVKELLPKYKRSPARVDAENMQVLNAQGKIVSPYSVKWSQYSASYFPFRLRQSTGCDNSLGIIKFNLTSPFDVYLHDTNSKGLFKTANRYRSHGCMRVEKAIELGNLLLNNKLDTAYLQACIKGEKPVTMKLENPVPVFVIYATAEKEENGGVIYYKDVYRLQQLN